MSFAIEYELMSDADWLKSLASKVNTAKLEVTPRQFNLMKALD